MADCYIGDVTFDYPPFWVTKPARVSMGRNVRTRSGNMVMQRPLTVSQTFTEHKLIIEWVPMADIDRLKELAASGNYCNALLEESGSQVKIWFHPDIEQAVTNIKHAEWGEEIVHDHVEDKPTDIYNAELNFVIEDT